MIVISHTTETAFARRIRADALAAGARLVSITGEGKGWPEAIEAAPPERSETYTASYLAALLVFARLATALGGAEWGEADLAALPALVEAAGAEAPLIDRPTARLNVLCGAGPAAITAREGALKLREASRVLAEGFESEYLLHGSAVPLTGEDLLIAIDEASDPSGLTAGLARAAEKEGLEVVRLAPPPDLHPLLSQLPMTARLQALASHWADVRRVDPDTVILGPWADPALWSAGSPPSGPHRSRERRRLDAVNRPEPLWRASRAAAAVSGAAAFLGRGASERHQLGGFSSYWGALSPISSQGALKATWRWNSGFMSRSRIRPAATK